ncbi:putative membrane protein (plasmid) [Bacillus cereus]|nr:putative membrane protein [Bacillus cereus]AJI07983.1 putative membrane protein [Bacillus cereus G9241]
MKKLISIVFMGVVVSMSAINIPEVVYGADAKESSV